MGGGADGAFPRNPCDGGDRDRAVLRRGGAGAARLPAGVRAPRRPRGQRRAPAGGGDPRGGGEPRGHVARPAEPGREGGRRRRGASRRSRRPVHRGAGRSGGNGARHDGDPAQGTPRAIAVRVGTTDVETRVEGLSGRQLVGATAAAVLGIAVWPAVAHAWTPGTHIYLGESVLANLQQLPNAVADLLRAFPYDFLYGNIAADTSIAKKIGRAHV